MPAWEHHFPLRDLEFSEKLRQSKHPSLLWLTKHSGRPGYQWDQHAGCSSTKAEPWFILTTRHWICLNPQNLEWDRKWDILAKNEKAAGTNKWEKTLSVSKILGFLDTVNIKYSWNQMHFSYNKKMEHACSFNLESESFLMPDWLTTDNKITDSFSKKREGCPPVSFIYHLIKMSSKYWLHKRLSVFLSLSGKHISRTIYLLCLPLGMCIVIGLGECSVKLVVIWTCDTFNLNIILINRWPDSGVGAVRLQSVDRVLTCLLLHPLINYSYWQPAAINICPARSFW